MTVLAVLNTNKLAKKIPAGYALANYPPAQMTKVFPSSDVQKRAQQIAGDRMIGGFLHIPFKDPVDGAIYLQSEADLVPEKAKQRRKVRRAPVPVAFAPHIGKPGARRRRRG